MMKTYSRFFTSTCAWVATGLILAQTSAGMSQVKGPPLNAKAAAVLDAQSGKILYNKNAFIKLAPASTTKVMTSLVVFEKLPLDRMVTISRRAAQALPSRAGLTEGAQYSVKDLLVATLVASSNDAAQALAEAVAGSESAFADLMNQKAKSMGMLQTHFVNATGLTEKRKEHYSTAYDMARLIYVASKDARIDKIMGITNTFIYGSDGKQIFLRNHNKMLWKTPNFVKGKTGWTFASRHTFIGTNFSPDKKIAFSIMYSEKPWVDIENLAVFGLIAGRRR